VAGDKDGVFKDCDLDLSIKKQIAFFIIVLIICGLALLAVNHII
jgi:hypothetical protein